jgi:hypothetical protein
MPVWGIDSNLVGDFAHYFLKYRGNTCPYGWGVDSNLVGDFARPFFARSFGGNRRPPLRLFAQPSSIPPHTRSVSDGHP